MVGYFVVIWMFVMLVGVCIFCNGSSVGEIRCWCLFFLWGICVFGIGSKCFCFGRSRSCFFCLNYWNIVCLFFYIDVVSINNVFYLKYKGVIKIFWFGESNLR